MSDRGRLALAALAVALVLAPAAALHPAVAHLGAAGFANLSLELGHPGLVGLLLLGLTPGLPALAFTGSLLRSLQGMSRLRTLVNGTAAARLDELVYRRVPLDEILVFTSGVVRPLTFVSAGAERNLGRARLRAALLHEQAHQRRRDVLWRVLLAGISRGFTFLPGVAALVERDRLRSECEADDYALRHGAGRRDLFEAILSATAPGVPAVAGLTDASVEFRLLRLVDPTLPLPARPTAGFLALAAVVAVPAAATHLLALVAATYLAHMI